MYQSEWRFSKEIPVAVVVLFALLVFCVGWWAIKISERQTELMQRQAILSKNIEDVSYQVAALSSDVCNLEDIGSREKISALSKRLKKLEVNIKKGDR